MANIYRWDFDGSVLDQEADNDSDARVLALKKELTPQHRLWIQHTEPHLLIPTSEVTLDHKSAIDQNAKLIAEHNAIAETKELLAKHLLTPATVDEFVLTVNADAKRDIDQNLQLIEVAKESLYERLVSVQATLNQAIDETGFAPKPIAPDLEPDWSSLVIVGDRGSVVEKFPKLSDATFLQSAFDKFTEQDKVYISQLAPAVIDWLRFGGPFSTYDTPKVIEIVRTIEELVKS